MGAALVLLMACVSASDSDIPPPTVDKFQVLGPMHAEDVKKVITENKKAIASCYRKGLAVQPELSGKLRTSWSIKPDGSTSDFRVHEGSVENIELTTCVKAAITAWKFPPPQGAEVVVTYPFNFASRTEKVFITRK